MALTRINTNQIKSLTITPVDQYGAVADGVEITDASISSGSKILTSPSSPFTSADVGKRIIVWGAGSGSESLAATISTINNSGSITLSIAASTTANVVTAQYGTDNYTAFRATVAALVALGGGTLTGQGKYFICHGADGDTGNSQHNVNFPDSSNVTFNWSGCTLYGTITFDDGVTNTKVKNVTSIGGAFRPVGDRYVSATTSVWNCITVTYGENIKIIWPTVFVPPGGRAISIQARTSAADTTRLKNIYVAAIIQGPSNTALQYTTDGFDITSASSADAAIDGIRIEGIVRDVGRGIVSQSNSSYQNYNFNINAQVINPRIYGAQLGNIQGLEYDLSITNVNPDAAASAITYYGQGFIGYGCDSVYQTKLEVIGANISTLVTAITHNTAIEADFVLNNTSVSMYGASYKWQTGLLLVGPGFIANNTVIAASTLGFAVSAYNNTATLNGAVFRSCTTNYGSPTTTAIYMGYVTVLNYQSFPYGGVPTGAISLYTANTGNPRPSNIPIGAVAYASLGADTAITNGGHFYTSFDMPTGMTITGVAVLNGSANTDKLIVSIYDERGVVIGSSALAGTTSSGTNTFQLIPLSPTPLLVIGPSRIFVGVQGNGTTAKIRTIAANTYIECNTDYAAGTFGTIVDISPPTTFTGSVGPIVYLY